MYVVTLTERTPTPPEEKDVNVITVRYDNFKEALDFLEDAWLNCAVVVNASVTYVQED